MSYIVDLHLYAIYILFLLWGKSPGLTAVLKPVYTDLVCFRTYNMETREVFVLSFFLNLNFIHLGIQVLSKKSNFL